MIYVINSTFYNKDTKELIDLVKIGYTKDLETRYISYRSHCPVFKVLYELEGDELDERVLHKHFSDIIYPDYGKEWFKYDQSIIDFFEQYKKIEDIRSSLKEEYDAMSLSKYSYAALHKELEYFVNRWLIIKSGDNIKELNKNAEDVYNIIKTGVSYIGGFIKCKNDIDKYLKRKYNISDEMLAKIHYIPVDDSITEESQNFLSNFEDKKSFYDKMRMLCEAELSESNISFILDQIPLIYKNYYLTLGPERCRANGYNTAKIEREYKDLILDKSDLKEMIYANFEVGKRYLMTDAKDKIKEIYEKVGYNKSPKATDLDIYFEIKRCKVSVEGKQQHGFEILKKK